MRSVPRLFYPVEATVGTLPALRGVTSARPLPGQPLRRLADANPLV